MGSITFNEPCNSQMLILGSKSLVVFLAPPGGVDKQMHFVISSRLLIVFRDYESNPSSFKTACESRCVHLLLSLEGVLETEC